MRISSNQIFYQGLNGMLTQQLEVLKIQQQLSSGKKFESPSDNPVAAATIDLMQHRMNWTGTMQRNSEAAISSLSFESSVLDNTVNVIQRLRELQVQGGNTALSEADRKASSAEVKNLLGQLQELGNTQDSNGYYLFSGGKSATEPFTKDITGSYIYNGDETQRLQTISSGLDVAVNDNGNDIFMRIPNGNGFFTVSQLPGNTGTVAASTGNIVDPSSYVVDNYSINFALNSSNQLVVLVTGATSGNVLPPSGLPDDAPLYQDGISVDFNGMQISFVGVPQPGDSFSTKPSQNESIFSTAQRMFANLNHPFSTGAEKAAVQTENNQLMMQLDSALNNVLNYQAQVGARLNQLDMIAKVNDDVIQISLQTLDVAGSVNMDEAVVHLNLQMIYLEAAQKSFSKIEGLSLFNYI